jgi:putative SOS response-associated peptidase YedK
VTPSNGAAVSFLRTGFTNGGKSDPKKTALQLWLGHRLGICFCGLWDRWRDPKNNLIETYTILATRRNALVADVHDRMPAILRVEDYECWLDPGITNTETVVDCLKPFDTSLMRKYPVGTRVNRPENEDEKCAREVSIENTAIALF